MVAYKIVEWKNGDPHTLFHGIDGSRRLPRGRWIEAEKKQGVDGGGQEPYLTGIHVFRNRKKAEGYLDNFRVEKDRRVIEVRATGLRQKPTNGHVWLADRIFIPAY